MAKARKSPGQRIDNKINIYRCHQPGLAVLAGGVDQGKNPFNRFIHIEVINGYAENDDRFPNHGDLPFLHR